MTQEFDIERKLTQVQKWRWMFWWKKNVLCEGESGVARD